MDNQTIGTERNRKEDSPSVCECMCSHMSKSKAVEPCKIDVLGTIYTIKFCGVDTDPQLENYDGTCDFTTKEILIKNDHKVEADSLKNMKVFKNKVLRHELVHAFLYESGLSSQSFWAENEEMVDWIAIQLTKLNSAWEEAYTQAIEIGQL